MPIIGAPCFEAITTADVSTFITAHGKSRGLAPKTANRYREIIVRLFDWAMQQRGGRMHGDHNPAARVERYRESAPETQYLSLAQIEGQFAALADHPPLQTMVAVLFYAGLRPVELLWLTLADVELPEGPPGREGMLRRAGVQLLKARLVNAVYPQADSKTHDWAATRPSPGTLFVCSLLTPFVAQVSRRCDRKGSRWEDLGMHSCIYTVRHGFGCCGRGVRSNVRSIDVGDGKGVTRWPSCVAPDSG